MIDNYNSLIPSMIKKSISRSEGMILGLIYELGCSKDRLVLAGVIKGSVRNIR